MAVWVYCQGGPSYFGGWAADMGPYIGPWPLLPPGEMGGLDPAHSDEVDFFVALPNPAAPTDVTVVADGSYATPIWDAYRYFTGTALETAFDYFGDATGGTASVPATPPTGAHLYVIVYAGGSPFTLPPNPPEFYVPATYAAGGAAALETAMGHWSTAQPGFTQTQAVAFSGSDDYSYIASQTNAGDRSVPSDADARLADVLAATPVSGSAWPAIDANKDGSAVETTVHVAGSVSVRAFDGSGVVAGDFPPGLSLLTYGVDYYAPPQIGPDGGADDPPYQYTAAPSWAWSAGALDGQYGEQWEDESSGATLPIGIQTKVQWVSGSSLGGRPWTVAGNLIADIVSPSKPVPPAGLDSYALDYSSVTALTFCIVMAPQFLYDGTMTGIPNLTMPGVGASTGYQDGPIISPSTPVIEVDRSTWQYWVPGDVVPTLAWHTIAGSWASISGAPMAIFTPGLGPVDYADGPA